MSGYQQAQEDLSSARGVKPGTGTHCPVTVQCELSALEKFREAINQLSAEAEAEFLKTRQSHLAVRMGKLAELESFLEFCLDERRTIRGPVVCTDV